jgi:hypothetical protein
MKRNWTQIKHFVGLERVLSRRSALPVASAQIKYIMQSLQSAWVARQT